LAEYDIITTLRNNISGHFTILKNTAYFRCLYKTDDKYIELFKEEKYRWFDESHFSEIVSSLNAQNTIKVYWPQEISTNGIESAAFQEYIFDKWIYENGKIFELVKDKTKKEFMYLHFINWKIMMKKCEINLNENHFYISYDGIHLKPHSTFAHFINSIKNLFYGFYVKEFFRIKRYKYESLKKRVLSKIGKAFRPK
jgi:hypothetical protein